MILSPMEVFEVKPIADLVLFDMHLPFTNTLFYSLLAAAVIIVPYYFAGNSLVPTPLSTMLEATVATITTRVSEQVGANRTYFLPFAYSLFFFVLVTNLFGNIPYNYTVGTSLIVTMGLSLTIWLATTALATHKHGLHFFSFFLPAGTPIVLVPMLAVIELISYFSRAISLGIRLIANRVSGHMLRNIIAIFRYNGIKGIISTAFILVPITLFCALVGLECAVSFIQAFVFTILTLSYLKDAIDLH